MTIYFSELYLAKNECIYNYHDHSNPWLYNKLAEAIHFRNWFHTMHKSCTNVNFVACIVETNYFPRKKELISLEIGSKSQRVNHWVDCWAKLRFIGTAGIYRYTLRFNCVYLMCTLIFVPFQFYSFTHIGSMHHLCV